MSYAVNRSIADPLALRRVIVDAVESDPLLYSGAILEREPEVRSCREYPDRFPAVFMSDHGIKTQIIISSVHVNVACAPSIIYIPTTSHDGIERPAATYLHLMHLLENFIVLGALSSFRIGYSKPKPTLHSNCTPLQRTMSSGL